MPSEHTTGSIAGEPGPTRSTGLPDALRPLAEAFHSQVSLASEEVREWHLHHEDAVADPAGVLAAELGTFAAGRIDPARMASVVGVEDAPDPVLHHVMALAQERFETLVHRGDEAFRVVLPPGGDLRDAVRDALAELGRAFAMGRAVEKARTHRFAPDEDHLLLRPWPFHRWAPSEAAMAPPLVVELDGSDLRASGLAEFLDGRVRVVLRVRGQAPPAALARLVSPGVFVAQVTGEAEEALARLVAAEAPGVVACFEPDAGAIGFVHDPVRGLAVETAAVEASIAEVSELRGQPGLMDLRHLEGLAVRTAAAVSVDEATPVETEVTARPEAAAHVELEAHVESAAPAASAPAVAAPAPAEAGASEAGPATPEVDRLAAWLLANLPDGPDTD